MTPDHAESADASTDDHFLAPSVRTFPWLQAALAAVAVFVVEYLLVAALFVVGPSSVDRNAAPINSTVDVLVQYAHILFNAHHVPTITRATVQIGGSPLANDLYIATDASVPPVVFFLIPMVALVVAGGVFEAYRRGTPPRASSRRVRSSGRGSPWATSCVVSAAHCCSSSGGRSLSRRRQSAPRHRAHGCGWRS
ncbi:hypothetical protein ACFQH8_11375 [Halomicroarcula sp. GCM10025710]